MKKETMLYSDLCGFYERIEHTSKRLEMTDLLVKLFKSTPPSLIEKVIYLTQGKLHPDWTGAPEIGIAEKTAIKAISHASGGSEDDISKAMKKLGDLGLVAEQQILRKTQVSLEEEPLTVSHVYETLDKIARAQGPGTQNIRIRGLAGLITNATPLEARYLIRTVTKTLRLGIADMTILDALAIAFTGSVKNREELERAYNVRSDLGEVANILVKTGLEGVNKLGLTIGRPVRMMLAQRASTPEEIIEKLGGICACEYKLDGERIQCHKNGDDVSLFSRHLENVTEMYPDVAELIRKNVTARTLIAEGECVAQTAEGKLQPFQVLMRRRRKYDIEKMRKEIPVALFLFDILYLDGENLTLKPYIQRRRLLESIVSVQDRIKPVPSQITNDPMGIDQFFHSALESGTEGLILKALDSRYAWGARSWRWIKLKESYRSKMIEPVDLVVVGAFWGRGKRAGTYGTLLVACYDSDKDTFPTITKVATGFTDEDLSELPKKLEPYRIKKKHARVETNLDADVWFTPNLVIEVIGDEITHSPIHLAAYNRLRKDSGLAIRFPRFTGRWRVDKAPEEATTVNEIIDIFNMQK
ncbi:MAG: ATP-dependent DNA ligase [Candidatus Ranarchaeia archaeon]